MSFQPRTTNPYIMEKKLYVEGGGFSPAVLEEIQTEISVLGSENAAMAQDIVDIKGSLNSINADLIDIRGSLNSLTAPYSTTLSETGETWFNDKVYKKVFYFENGISISSSGASIENDTDAGIITEAWASDGLHGYAPIQGSVETGTLKAYAIGSTLSGIKYVVMKFTLAE